MLFVRERNGLDRLVADTRVFRRAVIIESSDAEHGQEQHGDRESTKMDICLGSEHERQGIPPRSRFTASVTQSTDQPFA